MAKRFPYGRGLCHGVFPFLFLSLPVLAAAPAAEWQLREIRRPQGSLDYCVADLALPDGNRLNLAQDPEGRMNLGLVIPQLILDPQAPPQLQWSLDKRLTQTTTARVLTPQSLLLDIPDAAKFAAAWRKTRRLTLHGLGKKPRVFPLGKTGEVLTALQDCAAQQERALPPVILDLLQQAGLAEDTRLVPPPSGLSMVEIAWQHGAISGGTAAFDPLPDFRGGVRGELAVMKNFCQGLWSEEMGLIFVQGAAQQQQGLLSCNAGGRDEVMAVVFHAPGDGTARYYTHAGSSQDRDAVITATAALAKALLQTPR